jgi:hypothetical protein
MVLTLAVLMVTGMVSPVLAQVAPPPTVESLPPVQENVTVVGQANVVDRTPVDAPEELERGTIGRTADVNVYGNYAYLNQYFQPNCQPGTAGTAVFDLTDPANPVELQDAFMEHDPRASRS